MFRESKYSHKELITNLRTTKYYVIFLNTNCPCLQIKIQTEEAVSFAEGRERRSHGNCSLWKGDEWLLLSWQIVRKAIQDITTVITEQLIDFWEVLQWIYYTRTENGQDNMPWICLNTCFHKQHSLCFFCCFYIFWKKVKWAWISQPPVRGSILDVEMRRWARKEEGIYCR